MSNVFNPAHCIRQDISSSNLLRFDVTPNTDGPIGHDRRVEVARQLIYHDAGHQSHVLLPAIAR